MTTTVTILLSVITVAVLITMFMVGVIADDVRAMLRNQEAAMKPIKIGIQTDVRGPNPFSDDFDSERYRESILHPGEKDTQ